MKKLYMGLLIGGAAAMVVAGGTAAASFAVANVKDIGEQEAKQIACETAEISEQDVERMHVIKDREGGRPVYEVSFVKDGMQYDYEIAASNGKVLDQEVEMVEPPEQPENPEAEGEQAQEEYITEDEAKKIVNDRVPGSAPDDIQMEQEMEGGIVKFEGSLNYEGKEYDFELDAKTGSILHWKEEKKDGLLD